MKKQDREVLVTAMSMDSYMKIYGEAYQDGELYDYPQDELSHVLKNTDIEKLALIDDRLFEMS